MGLARRSTAIVRYRCNTSPGLHLKIPTSVLCTFSGICSIQSLSWQEIAAFYGFEFWTYLSSMVGVVALKSMAAYGKATDSLFDKRCAAWTPRSAYTKSPGVSGKHVFLISVRCEGLQAFLILYPYFQRVVTG
jgi:hypothetical protein